MATADLALNTIGQIGVPPAGHVPWTCWLTLTIWISARQPWSRVVFGTDLAPSVHRYCLMVAPTGALPWRSTRPSCNASTPNGAGHWLGASPESDRKLGVKVGNRLDHCRSRQVGRYSAVSSSLI